MPTEQIPSPFVELSTDEGNEAVPYQDTEGNWTVGVGHNLGKISAETARGIHWTAEQIVATFRADYSRAVELTLHHYQWVADLDVVRRRTIYNMCFNMGLGGLEELKSFMRLMERHQFKDAATDLEHTKWYSQVKERGPRLAARIRTGLYFNP